MFTPSRSPVHFKINTVDSHYRVQLKSSLYQEVHNNQSLYSNMTVDALKYLLFKFNIYEISGRVLLHCVYTL